MICQNCQNDHQANYCPVCGQPANVSKITFQALISSFLGTITNMNKGFLYNVKNLTLSPQRTISNYLNGKRIGVFNPLSYLILTTSIYLLLDSLLPKAVVESRDPSNLSKPYLIGYEAGKFIKLYFKYFWVFGIVFLSTSTKLFLKRYNFAEHLAINSFVIGHATLIGLFGALLFNQVILFNSIVYLAIWVLLYRFFVAYYNKVESIIFAFTSTFLFFIQLILTVVTIGFIKTL